MRDIKFRAWDGNKIISGDVQLDYDDSGPSFETEGLSMSGLAQMYERKGWKLMQYTGLKDKNGKEIFEGDIVKHVNGDVLTIVYDTLVPWFVFREADGTNYLPAIDDYRGLEVLGNIYEDSHLVGDTKKEVRKVR